MITEADVERAAIELEIALIEEIRDATYMDLLQIGFLLLEQEHPALVSYDEAITNWNGDR